MSTNKKSNVLILTTRHTCLRLFCVCVSIILSLRLLLRVSRPQAKSNGLSSPGSLFAIPPLLPNTAGQIIILPPITLWDSIYVSRAPHRMSSGSQHGNDDHQQQHVIRLISFTSKFWNDLLNWIFCFRSSLNKAALEQHYLFLTALPTCCSFDSSECGSNECNSILLSPPSNTYSSFTTKVSRILIVLNPRLEHS